MEGLTYIPTVRGGGETSQHFIEWEGPGTVLKRDDTPFRERLLDVIIPLEESMSVAEIAEQVGCETEITQAYIEWFVSMGIVIKHPCSDDHPVEYERSLTTAMEARRMESDA